MKNGTFALRNDWEPNRGICSNIQYHVEQFRI